MTQQIRLLDTGEDAVNIDLHVSLPYHLPFDMLGAYYDGHIHRRLETVNGRKPDRVGHEILPITGMFGSWENLEGSWFEQGVHVGAHHYDCREVLGMHMRGDREQEFVIYAVESVNGCRPTASVVRNFTDPTDLKIPVAGHNQVAQAHNWRSTISRNLPKIENNWGDAPGCERIIYVGSGPSLRRNWHDLLEVDRTKCQIWAANEAFSFLLSKGIAADCFFCIDATSPKRWWDGLDCSETCLVAAPFVTPEVTEANWKEVFWFNISGDGAYYNMVRKHHPELFEIDATKGVGSSMIESSWSKGVKHLAMLGCDFCYEKIDKEVYRSVWHSWSEEEWQEIATRYAHYVVTTMTGETSLTYIGLATECAAVFAAAQCLSEKGILVTNSSEGGCLFVNPAAKYLASRPAVLEHKPLRECLDFLSGKS